MKRAAEFPYHIEAFSFVLGCFPVSVGVLTTNHVLAEQICWRIHDQAMTVFGSFAREQMECWEIQSCEDFGRIVEVLVECRLVTFNSGQRPSEFRNFFDFDSAFDSIRMPPPSGSLWQFGILNLLAITTLIAIVLTGFRLKGMDGVGTTLFVAWMLLVGLYSLVGGLRQSPGNRLVPIVCGICGIVFGLAMIWLAFWM